MIRRLLSLVLCLPALGLTACVSLENSPGIRIATDPPGARVLLNGRDTGFLTPAFLDLEGNNGRIDMELDGYQTASRLVRAEKYKDSTHWEEMDIGPSTWRFPLWVDYDDFLGMWRWVDSYEPARIFVRLRLSGGA